MTLQMAMEASSDQANDAAQALGAPNLACLDPGEGPLKICRPEKARIIEVIRKDQPLSC
jgi:hypothetical protein